MSNVFTERQLKEISAFKRNEFKRINLWDGSVRSGKTWITIVIWAFWVAMLPKGSPLIMIGKSLTALKRNVLDVLEDIVGSCYFSYSTASKEAFLFGNKIYLEGANDARSEGKIRGLTLMGAYCDELTLFPSDFFKMLLSRLSMPDAKLFATTNPDAPHHWLKTEFIDRIEEKNLDMRIAKFLIDDNTTLEPEYISNLKKEYTGVFYDRYILGLWKPAEGAIYRVFIENEQDFYTETAPQFKYITIGVDFGGSKSKHAFCASGITHDFKELYFLKAEEHNAANVNPDQLNKLFNSFYKEIIERYGQVDAVYADSAEQTLINGMRTHCTSNIRNSVKHEIIDRIRATTSLMSQRRLKIVKDECSPLIKFFQSAVYDSKKLDDVRLDDGSYNNDIGDAAEYSWERYMKHLIRQ